MDVAISRVPSLHKSGRKIVALRASPLFRKYSAAHSVSYYTDNPLCSQRFQLNGPESDAGTAYHVAIDLFNSFTTMVVLL
jgi:hypothetical protein